MEHRHNPRILASCFYCYLLVAEICTLHRLKTPNNTLCISVAYPTFHLPNYTNLENACVIDLFVLAISDRLATPLVRQIPPEAADNSEKQSPQPCRRDHRDAAEFPYHAFRQTPKPAGVASDFFCDGFYSSHVAAFYLLMYMVLYLLVSFCFLDKFYYFLKKNLLFVFKSIKIVAIVVLSTTINRRLLYLLAPLYLCRILHRSLTAWVPYCLGFFLV